MHKMSCGGLLNVKFLRGEALLLARLPLPPQRLPPHDFFALKKSD